MREKQPLRPGRKWASWLLLLLLSLTWGSSYILIKKGLVAFSPVQLASLRITISALAFTPLFIHRFKRIDWSKWKALLIVGISGSALPAFFFAFAQTQLSSSLTGLLSSLTPLATFILAFAFFGGRFGLLQFTGVILGLAGAALLVWFGQQGGGNGNIWYGLLVVAATFCYGLSSNTVAERLQDVGSLTISSSSFFLIGIPGLISLFATDIYTVLDQHPQGWISLGYVAILALAGTVVASILFFQLVKLTNAVFASFVSYLVPVVALGWGIADGEPVTMTSLTGMILILGGVYLARNR